jgi:hypothetical protein
MIEILFIVEEAAEGGYVARAVNASIVTEADDIEQLRTAVRDAVRCHCEEADRPKVIRLHLVRDEVIAAWNPHAVQRRV